MARCRSIQKEKMMFWLMVAVCLTIVFTSCRKQTELFFIKNNQTSFYFSGPSLDRYYAEMERFYDRPDADMWSQYAFQDSLFATGEYFPDLERRYDRDNLPEGYLQRRIEDALNQWHTSPFARELDFAGFCEYLLPYRIGTEEPEEWWTDYLGLTTYLCRSYGIPVATDYTPQWGNHSQGHQWSALIQGGGAAVASCPSACRIPGRWT